MSDNTHLVCNRCGSVVGIPNARLGDKPKCPTCKEPMFGGKPAELTESNFAKYLERNDLPLVVDFWAPWCGPCLAMAPQFERVAIESSQMRFAKLDTQNEPGPAGQFAIRSIPTLIVFKGGKPASRQSGAMDAATLKRWLSGI